MMREKFKSLDAGFFFVQIAPCPYDDPSSWLRGYFCEAQEATLKTIPNSGMVTTLDIGGHQTIHPHKKLEVGQRLAYVTLSKGYGFNEIEASSLSYKSIKIDGDRIIVEFDGCQG